MSIFEIVKSSGVSWGQDVALDPLNKMLSNPLHRFSYPIPQSGIITTGHASQNSLHNNGLDSLAHNSQYNTLHSLNHSSPHGHNASTQLPQAYRGRQSSISLGRATTPGGGPVRRRISRACDQCNQLRTKCDGQHPCAHCIGEKAHS